MPRRVERISGAPEHGRPPVNVRPFAGERDRRYATGLLEQLLLTVLGATADAAAKKRSRGRVIAAAGRRRYFTTPGSIDPRPSSVTSAPPGRAVAGSAG
jgi:hypothetical protein